MRGALDAGLLRPRFGPDARFQIHGRQLPPRVCKSRAIRGEHSAAFGSRVEHSCRAQVLACAVRAKTFIFAANAPATLFLDVLLFCHRTLVQPAVTVKAGKMIKPIAVPKSKLRSVGAEKANLI